MNHYASPAFWERYRSLPEARQKVADKNFGLLKDNPRHPSLRLKKVGALWSARVGNHYRVLGMDAEDGILWFWIGTHADYDKLLS